MTQAVNDTIFSLSSGAGRAGVAVFRISGPDALPIAKTLSRRELIKPRYAHLARLRDEGGDDIDEALLLYFPAPHSFTGEEVVELHCHGSQAVKNKLAETLHHMGARQAEAGEFTRRAVMEGQMDLTEAEGLADLIDAETQLQHKQAMRQMRGGLKDIYEGWKESLLDALAQIEGEIDFPDEEDIPDGLSHRAYPILSNLLINIDNLIDSTDRGQKTREGIWVTLIGAPNAGKSSILNRLAGSEIAIVTDQAGTTRDIVTVDLVINGMKVTLADTAGLREASDQIESEGIRRAKQRAEQSDLRLWVIDGPQINLERPDEITKDDLCLLNKSDLNKSDLSVASDILALSDLTLIPISAKTGRGFDALMTQLSDILTARFAPLQDVGLTRERHKICVQRARDHIAQARDNLGIAPELTGEDIRATLQAIRELAGDSDIEQVFDRIFSRFCVGK